MEALIATGHKNDKKLLTQKSGDAQCRFYLALGTSNLYIPEGQVHRVDLVHRESLLVPRIEM